MHLLAVLEYDGTEFVGFQRQKRGRSVQGEFERALDEFGEGPVRIVGGGRTDAGVHAQGQTASFSLNWTREVETLKRALNAKLPRDLAVNNLFQVPENFSARYSAQSRVYEYRVYNQPDRSAFLDRYALWVPEKLNIEAMQAAARLLIGTYDFGAFGTAPHGTNTVREMKQAVVRSRQGQVGFEFEANAFLYRMVRRLVGTLLQVGRGRINLKEFQDTIACKHRAADSVPPHGLRLMQVKYDPHWFK